MNHVYRVVWSASLGMYQVASEIASSNGKKSRSVDRRARKVATVAALAVLAATPGPAAAQFVGSIMESDGSISPLDVGSLNGDGWGWTGQQLHVFSTGPRNATLDGAFSSISVDASASLSGSTNGIVINTPAGTSPASSVLVNGNVGGAATGVSVAGELGTLTNNGNITGQTAVSSTGAIGTITNTRLIQGGVTGINVSTAGVAVPARVDLIQNGGTIIGGGRGVYNDSSIGTIRNDAGGLVMSSGGHAIDNQGAIAAIENAGSIQGSSIGVRNLGALIGTLDNSGRITGGAIGVLNGAHIGTLSNSGLISVSGSPSGTDAVENFGTIGSVVNSGSIAGGSAVWAAGVSNGNRIDTLTNQSGGRITGDLGVHNESQTMPSGARSIGVLSNSGVIEGVSAGVRNSGSTITSLVNTAATGNAPAGTISATGAGQFVYGIDNTTVTVSGSVYGASITAIKNGGLISGARAGINNSGSIAVIDNLAGGTITGAQTGIIAGGTIGTINNAGGAVIQGATAIAVVADSLGAIHNAGAILGSVVNTTTQDLTITGATDGTYGTLTGADGASVGTIQNMASNLRFTSGSLVLNDNVMLSPGRTLFNSGAKLRVNQPLSVLGNYQQDAAGTLEIGVSGSAVTTGVYASDTGYGRLVVNGATTLAPGSTIALSSMGYTFAAGQRFIVIDSSLPSTYNENSLRYVVNGSTLVGGGVRQSNGNNVDLVVTLYSPNAVGTIGGTTTLDSGVPASSTGWSFDGRNLTVGGTTFGTITGAVGTVTNNGTLTGTSAFGIGAGVGSVDRFVNEGSIASTGPSNSGFYNGGVVGTLVNNGQITTATLAAVNNSGSMTAFENNGTVTGVSNGLTNLGTLSSVVNKGTVQATNGYGVNDSGRIGQLTNQGLISGFKGLVVNATNGVPATVGVVTNTGTITGALAGISNFGSTITKIDNLAGGSIAALGLANNTAAIENVPLFGTGVQASSIGTISNAGSITSNVYGIRNVGVIDRIDNLASGVITGLTGAIVQEAGASLGTINNAGTIAGDIINNSTQALSIGGAAGTTFGTLAGLGGGNAVGTIFSSRADVYFTRGNLLLNDSVDLGRARTLHNSAALLQVNRPLQILGNYDQGADATLQIGVSGLTEGSYGRLNVSGATSIAQGSTIALQSMGYAFAAGQRYVVIDTVGTVNYNEGTLRYVLNGAPTSLAASGAHVGSTLTVTLFTPQYLGTVDGTTRLVAGMPSGVVPNWSFDGANLSVTGTAQATITGHIGTLTNNGTIVSTMASNSALGIGSSGGQIDSIVNNGLITSSGGLNSGLYAGGVVGSIINGGTIQSDNLGGVNNTGALTSLRNDGLIRGATLGVANTGSLNSLTNTGTVEATVTTSDGVGVWSTSWLGTLTNSGQIKGYTGVMVAASGDVNLPSSLTALDNRGSITGRTAGVANYGGAIAAINNLTNGVITAGTGTAGEFAQGVYNSPKQVGGTLYGGTIGAINNAGLISAAYYGIDNAAAIGTINNQAGGLITGLGGAISNQAPTASIGQINNAGVIAGWVINRSQNDLRIAGATNGTFGTITSFGPTYGGTIVSTNADVRFNGGNLVIGNNFDLAGTRTAYNDASVLQFNKPVQISGNFAQAAGATLQIGVASNAVTTGDMTTDAGYGRLVVSGNTTLAAGSRVALQSLGYSFAPGQRYVVIDTAGTANYNESSLVYRVNGSTTLGATGANVANGNKRDLVVTVVSDPNAGSGDNGGSTPGNGGSTGGGANPGSGITPGGSAGGNTVTRPSFDPRTNATIASAPNAQSALYGLLGYTGISDARLLNLYNATLGSLSDGSSASADRVGKQLAPSQNARAAGAATFDSLGVVNAHVNDLRLAQAGGTGVATGDSGAQWSVWGQAFGGHASQSQRDGVDGYSANYGGLLVGADRAFGDHWRAGGAFQFSRTNINNDGSTSGNSTGVNGYGLIGYAAYTGEPWYVNLSGSVVLQRYDTKRFVTMQGFSGTANGNFNGQQYVASAEFGWPLALGRAVVTPLASVTYSYLNQNSYTETGGNGTALTVGSAGASSVRSALGAKFAVPFETSAGTWVPELSVRWVHEYNRTRQATSASFAADPLGQTGFTSVGATPVSNLADVALGLTLVRSNNLSASIRYDLQAGSGFVSHTGIVRVQQRF
ncbi:autotransporter domain-containing protein [Pandoraea pulmonicola]|uniref:ROmp B n=1 Tax=Pandoraea pulmonicola TaxID=93221 RepID=A0AAJ4ZAH6_PANPU|nr:autotransporter domain-containing protein [Pandoraea pulmonicola]APD13364.1 hypothetical protein RO07_25240 [Pandoraea pulmonicola]SUA89800.1 rOmp B [Pandoraea pulmonicola]